MSESTGERWRQGIDPLWSVQQVSYFLGVPVDTLYAWRHRGIGPKAHKVGRHLRYNPDEVWQWLDRSD